VRVNNYAHVGCNQEKYLWWISENISVSLLNLDYRRINIGTKTSHQLLIPTDKLTKPLGEGYSRRFSI
jgi:hypothetical protein